MLFNSYEYIFLFLPPLLALWWLVGSTAPQRLPLLLLGASLIFYGLWGLPFLVLLLAMVALNYALGCRLATMPDDVRADDVRPDDVKLDDAAAHTDDADPEGGSASPCRQSRQSRQGRGLSRKGTLALAVVLNLLPLCYFKYSLFFVQNLNALLGSHIVMAHPGLPLGISFYTFLQIAWLVTVYRRQVTPQGLTNYALFTSCFPYVISGPIVRYEQVAPQFAGLQAPQASNLGPAITVFCMGLAKKVLLADTLAAYANNIFNAAEKGFPLTSAEAWVGSLAYTFQLYFDFSGYTDMAIGVALLLGIRLPDNFDSPYKSTGIVDFWRRWHITLSSWLRDFLYIPLGGSRQGKLKQYRNLFLTMLLGGVWHGAGWPFVVWGAVHGAMLTVNHFFRTWIKGRAGEALLGNPLVRVCSIIFTFLCINAAWVVFRAETMTGAVRMYTGMWQGLMGGLCAPWAVLFQNNYVQGLQPLSLLALSFALVWAFPNTREIVFGRKGGRPWLRWTPSAAWAAGLAGLTFLSLIMLSRKSAFLYFQF